MTCYQIKHDKFESAFLCMRSSAPHCSDGRCGDVGEYLCDYPVGNGRTCDRPLCQGHAFEVAPEIHYCPGHELMWREFKEAGGVSRELGNVVPYREKDT